MSFAVLDQAAARWDQLVEREADSEERLALLTDDLAGRGIVAGGRPLCTVLRPHMISEELFARQAAGAAQVISALGKVRDAVLADERLRELHLGSLLDWVGELLELEPPGAGEGTLARLDASLARTRLHFIELNADCPQGAGHHDSILDFFEGLETFELFAREYRVRPLRLVPQVGAALLGAWRRWGGTGTPAVAMVTRTADAAIVSNLEYEAAEYRGTGIEAEICDYSELSFEGGRLRARGRQVDLLYRVMPTAMCLELRDELKPMFAAVRAGAVCMVNPFRAELLGHKALFALLSDPTQDFGFDGSERAAIREHVPWTRQLVEGPSTDEQGDEVDLIEHVLAEREHLVLKPAHQFGGRGVELGWHLDEGEWERALQDGLGGDYIVQRRVSLHRAGYPTMDAPGSRRSFFEDTDPFAFGGRIGGMLTRLSGGEITNVHAGGSLAASFAIEPR